MQDVQEQGLGEDREGLRPLLCEVSWEVCNQAGGIYTVIRSKAPTAVGKWSGRYLLIGPYDPAVSPMEFEEVAWDDPVERAVEALRGEGIEAHHGRWLVSGEPPVVLLDPRSAFARLGEIKRLFWEHHHIALPGGNELLDRALVFGHLVERFFRALLAIPGGEGPMIAHFHEWMAGTAIPELRRAGLPIAIVFTTHATSLGRYLAMHDPQFHDHVPWVDWWAEARRFNIDPQVQLERASAHGAHVFTTVSDITARECEHLLGRRPDVLLPNGMNIERYLAIHEFQNQHLQCKEKIRQFVIGHFFPSYTFNIDRTLYFFTSGRYEYRNKGYDLSIDALANLNARMKESGDDRRVVFFLLSPRPHRSGSAEVLQTQAQMEEMRRTCDAIGRQMAERLLLATAQGQTPSLDELVDDYWRLRLHRLRHSWRVQQLPAIVTHDLMDDAHDEVLCHLRGRGLINRAEDPVKVVYYPDFLTPSIPLLGLEYDQFVRGCHLGVFPSSYEPWGYTPQECVARAVPAITSDLSGFGAYVMANIPDYASRGLFVVHRRGRSYESAVEELAGYLWDYVQLGRRGRIELRNRVEGISEHFDWSNLIRHYEEAYELVCRRAGVAPQTAGAAG